MESDLGLFRPGTVSWRVLGEPIAALGGLRSLYLQALHPRAAAGVAQNSAYRTDPWRRLVHTWGYLRTVLYGTTAEAHAAAERVRELHARMRATDPRTGEEFRLDEPDLLRWVHVAEVESFVTTVRRAGVRLSDADVDRFHSEQRRSAALIGLDPASVPGTAAEVAAYYDTVRPGLGLTADAAGIADFLRRFPPLPGDLRLGLAAGPARLAYRGVTATAIGLLPPWARRLYGHPGGAAAGVSARAARLLVRVALPPRYRVQPRREEARARWAA